MLDKDAAALAVVPKPVLRPQPFITGVVLYVAMQKLTETPAVNQPADD